MLEWTIARVFVELVYSRRVNESKDCWWSIGKSFKWCHYWPEPSLGAQTTTRTTLGVVSWLPRQEGSIKELLCKGQESLKKSMLKLHWWTVNSKWRGIDLSLLKLKGGKRLRDFAYFLPERISQYNARPLTKSSDLALRLIKGMLHDALLIWFIKYLTIEWDVK